MTVAEDLLHRHLETLLADNARWQTLIQLMRTVLAPLSSRASHCDCVGGAP
jgi:hypothetical protein